MYNHPNSGKRRFRFPRFLLFVPVLLLLLSGIVMLLWNAILPSLLGVNAISYWQAAGLLLLCRILFGGFRFGAPGGGRSFGPPKHIREKWMNMSREEKDQFKNEWRKRCRPKPPEPEQ